MHLLTLDLQFGVTLSDTYNTYIMLTVESHSYGATVLNLSI